MQQQSVSNNEFSVALKAIELNSFYDKTVEQGIVVSPDNLQVAHSVAIVVKGDNGIEIDVGLKYGVAGDDYSEIRLALHYSIINLSAVMNINRETNQVSFDESLLYTILPASFSMAKGYYAAKLENSPLAVYPYPIIKTEAIVSNCRILLGGVKR